MLLLSVQGHIQQDRCWHTHGRKFSEHHFLCITILSVCETLLLCSATAGARPARQMLPQTWTSHLLINQKNYVPRWWCVSRGTSSKADAGTDMDIIGSLSAHTFVFEILPL
jgi:hypothetical protein